MSKLTLTQETDPGSPGANMASLFVLTGGNMSVRDATGVRRAPLTDANTGSIELVGKVSFDYTVAANVGAATINKPSGRVTAQTGTTNLVVTCNYCTANSIVIPVGAANDATGRVTSVVAAAGNFTLHYTAPAANWPINFAVLNT